MGEQVGWRGLVERLKAEAPRYAHIFPQLPRLAHRALEQQAQPHAATHDLLTMLVLEQRRTNRLIGFVAWLAGGIASGIVFAALFARYGHAL
jgi:ubiquinone biosynthesis protein